MGKVSPVVRQFLTIGCCNLLTLSFGWLSGWATINFVELQNENTTFPTGPLTLEEASLVSSILSLRGLVGNFAILPISENFGIKRTIHLLGIPLILSSLLIIWARNKYFLYASRALSGFVGGGLCVGIPTLIAEISHDKVRGTLNSLYDPLYNIGMLLSFYLGSQLDCLDQAKVQLIAPIIFVLTLVFLPESPQFHIKQNNEKRAIKSQKFFKGKHSVQEKLQFLMKPSNECVEKGSLGEKSDEKTEPNDKLTLSDFLTPHAKRASFISFTSLFFSFIGGVLIIIGYVTAIFTESGSTLSAKTSSFLVSFAQLSANIIFLNIVDRFQRRTLFLWSSYLTIISYFSFAAYCQFWSKIPGLEWIPPLCFSAIIFFGCLGILPIPFIITTEIFPPKIRGTCLAISASMLWIVFFVLGTAYPTAQLVLGLPVCMTIFGVITIISTVFGYFFLPETRGKSFEEITEMLSGEKTWLQLMESFRVGNENKQTNNVIA